MRTANILACALVSVMVMASAAFAWRARTVAEYQNFRIVESYQPENLEGAAGNIAEDRLATDGTAVRFAPGVTALRLNAEVDQPGAYSLFIYARVPDAQVDGPWAPAFMEMRVRQPDGAEVESSIRIAFQPTYQAVGQMYFLAPAAGEYAVLLNLQPASEVSLLVDLIEFRDPLDGCAFRPLKQGRYLTTNAELARRQAPPDAAEPDHDLPLDADVDAVAAHLDDLRGRLPAINTMLEGEANNAIRDLVSLARNRANEYQTQTSDLSGREAILALVALAERYPTFEMRVHDPSQNYGRVAYQRFSQASGHPYPAVALPEAYDMVWEYLRAEEAEGRDELVAAVSSRIPYIHNLDDLRAFLDRNILQYELSLCFRFARRNRILGWERWAITTILALGPNEVGQAWMDRLFRQTYADLTGDGGYADYLINGINRDGSNHDGATIYTQGAPARLVENAQMFERFVELGGSVPRFAYDPAVNPRLLEAGRFLLNYRTAGGFISIFGDGGGAIDHRFTPFPAPPDRDNPDIGAWLFKHSGDPRHAWMASKLPRPIWVSDEQWKAIQHATRDISDPVLHGRTFSMSGFGVMMMETGQDATDPRLKGAANIRTGTGMAHQHGDLLDLTLFAYNQRIIPDGGRSGWPWMRFTAQHNTIEVDRHSFQTTGVNSGAYGYPILLKEAGLARFASAGGFSSVHPDLDDYRREVVMVDLGVHGDEENPQHHYYVYDVNRVGGGKVHTYCAHGMRGTLDFNVEARPAPDAPSSLVYGAAEPRSAETVSPLVSTWNATDRAGNPQGHGLCHHLFGWDGLRLYTAKGTHRTYNDNIPFLWIERESDDPLYDTYHSVFEPFLDKPNLTAVTPLNVVGGGDGSNAARAVRVESRWGRVDTIVVNESGRMVELPWVGLTTDAHFAFIAEEDGEIVQSTIIGGTTLQYAGVNMTAAQAVYEGTVESIDFRTNRLILNPAPPAEMIDGALISFGRQPHMVAEYVNEVDGEIELIRSMETFRSPIKSVENGIVEPEIALPQSRSEPKFYWGTTATNEAHDSFWRVESTEVAEMWIPVLAPISENDIADADGDGRRTVLLTDFAPPEQMRDPVVLYYGPFEKPVRMRQFDRPPFEEPVELEVTQVDSERRLLYFEPPEDYDLVWAGWNYEGVTITNESGTRAWRGSYPAREFRIMLEGDQPATDADFTDEPCLMGEPADGVRRIHLYHFGPGDPYKLETFVSMELREDGDFELRGNVEAGAVMGE